MAWLIHEWSGDSGTGSIVSPHFGPLPFGPVENSQRITDFVPGEEVLPQLEGKAPNFTIIEVIPRYERQPPGTELKPFSAARYSLGDFRLDERSSDSLEFWLGDCCEMCSPNAPMLRFSGVTRMPFSDDDDPDFESPLLRLASPQEVHENQLEVASGSIAYCIVSDHGNGLDGPLLFLVAKRLELFE